MRVLLAARFCQSYLDLYYRSYRSIFLSFNLLPALSKFYIRIQIAIKAAADFFHFSSFFSLRKVLLMGLCGKFKSESYRCSNPVQ